MDHTKQGLDTPLNITNQAAMNVWYGQLNSEKWKFMINLIYNVVNDLGRQLTNVGVYKLMAETKLTNEKDIMTYFFIERPISEAQSTALFTDPIYGLNNLDNFVRWGGAFSPGYDIAKSLVF